ncbi:MAG: hypothetical protein ACRES7_05615 [Gammaproteobacteria bacterium]
MRWLHWLDFGISVLAVLSGLAAAGYWYVASRVQVAIRRGIGSGEAQTADGVVAVATMEAFSHAARLNRIAALWTGAAALLTGVSSMIAWFV